MANGEHLALVRRGAQAVREARERDPNLKLDLSQTNLDATDLSNLDLSGSDFSYATLKHSKFRNSKLTGANFSSALLDRADLTGADLSDANFTQTNLSETDLTEVKVTSKTTLACDLQSVKFSNDILRQANIAGANLANRDLRGIDLSGRDLRATNFDNAKLSEAKFSDSELTGARFENSQLLKATFRGANLAHATLHSANLTGADLVGANFSGAYLERANLHGANISNANFHEAHLDNAIFSSVEGAYRAKNLRTSWIRDDVHYFDQVVRKWPERVDWELIRTFGRLPLFGASYSALIVIPSYLYALEVYNDKVKAARAWIETSAVPAHVSKAILAHLHEEPIPSRWGLLLVSTILLAAASTIYAVRCPPRVKAFSRDQWCDEHRHSLVHYWADAWKMRWLRLICFGMYMVGGLGALYVLGTKLLCAGAILIGPPFVCF